MIVMVQSMLKMKLSYRHQSNPLQVVTKTKQDNDVTNRTDTVYATNEIELPSLIRPSVVCDEN